MTETTRRNSRLLLFLILLGLAITINLVSGFRQLIESQYATSLYQGFGRMLRSLTGWLPISLGDFLYLAVVLWIINKIFRFIKRLIRKQITFASLKKAAANLVIILLATYVVFNVFWGLNYNRLGISYQLRLNTREMDSTDLKSVFVLLMDKVNLSKEYLIQKGGSYPGDKEIFRRAQKTYAAAETIYPFLNYKTRSLKTSMFGWLGNYLGFVGYYNPFTGEAQVNTTVPRFAIPYTSCHEIAHQLGYAKEDEANFVGYLAATTSNDTLFHYSAYLDLLTYTYPQVYFIDSSFAKNVRDKLIPEVREDLAEYRKFMLKHKNPFEPVIKWLYGNYLKVNAQPHGIMSYNDVTAMLVAFYKKYGKI